MAIHKRPLRFRRLTTTVVICALAAGCTGRPPASPTPPNTVGGPAVPLPPPVPGMFVGQWEGSSTFQSLSGSLPSCIAPAWQPGAIQAVSAYVYPHQSRKAMNVRQRATDDCHLLLTESPGRLVGGPWPNPDELSCYFFPMDCTPGCHVRARSSEWNCDGSPPEVWIVDALLNTIVSGESDRLDGTLAFTYTHKPAGMVGGWQDFIVVSQIELRRSPQ